MATNLQPNVITPQSAIPETLPMLGTFKRATCFDCQADFDTSAEGQLHADLLDHSVLDYYESLVN